MKQVLESNISVQNDQVQIIYSYITDEVLHSSITADEIIEAVSYTGYIEEIALLRTSCKKLNNGNYYVANTLRFTALTLVKVTVSTPLTGNIKLEAAGYESVEGTGTVSMLVHPNISGGVKITYTEGEESEITMVYPEKDPIKLVIDSQAHLATKLADWDYTIDAETNTVEISGYHGASTDIVFPSVEE